MLIYKIMSSAEWHEFEATQIFNGSEVDIQDGFIHFSTKEQTIETANKHFAGQNGLVLVAVEEAKLGDKLIYETSRGGALFPHLYEALRLSAVAKTIEFEPNAQGSFQFPRDFQ